MSEDLSQFTSSYFPTWFVESLESLLANSKTKTFFFPHMLSTELPLLATFLNSAQSQLLSNKDKITYNEDVFFENCSSLRKNFDNSARRFLQSIPSFCLQSAEDKAPVSFFKNFKWESTNDGLELYLESTELSQELILGILNPLNELLRIYQKSPLSASTLRDYLPLWLPRSVWLELNPTEQMFLLKLLKASQWHQQILDLDGTSQESVDKLLYKIVTQEKKSKRSSTELTYYFSFLKKLGMKLISHGVLKSDHQIQYLLFNKNESATNVVWLPDNRGILQSLNNYYLPRVGQLFLKKLCSQKPYEWLKIMSAGKLSEEQVNIYWRVLDRASKSHEDDHKFLNYKNSVLPTACLFVEWHARITTKSLKLPTEVIANELHNKMLKESTEEGLLVLYQSFLNNVKLDRSLQQKIFSTRDFSMHSKATQESEEFKLYIQTLRKPSLDPQVTLTTGNKPTQKSNNLAPEIEQVSEAPIANSSTNFISASLLKTAREELAKIRRFDHDSYQRLKENYLSSLDEHAKTLILELERRMLPDMFEDQLRDRIVGFMVMNPNIWKSKANSNPKKAAT